jgi:hypothetical protein
LTGEHTTHFSPFLAQRLAKDSVKEVKNIQTACQKAGGFFYFIITQQIYSPYNQRKKVIHSL